MVNQVSLKCRDGGKPRNTEEEVEVVMEGESSYGSHRHTD